MNWKTFLSTGDSAKSSHKVTWQQSFHKVSLFHKKLIKDIILETVSWKNKCY